MNDNQSLNSFRSFITSVRFLNNERWERAARKDGGRPDSRLWIAVRGCGLTSSAATLAACHYRLSRQLHAWQGITGSPMASADAVNIPAGPEGQREGETKHVIYPPSSLPLHPHCPSPLDFFQYLRRSSSHLTLLSLSTDVNYFSIFLFLQPEAISTFTSEPTLVSFAEFFCNATDGMQHVSLTLTDQTVDFTTTIDCYY